MSSRLWTWQVILVLLYVLFLLCLLSPARAQNVAATPLTLLNGWTGSASASEISGIVSITGTVQTTTINGNGNAFTLPTTLAPATVVVLPISFCKGAPGRLYIAPSGVATIQSYGYFTAAQCGTTLTGAWFVRVAAGFTPITPAKGWAAAPWKTSSPAGKLVKGTVYLKGALATPFSNATAFTLPAALAPTRAQSLPVVLCYLTTGSRGTLNIATTGLATVQASPFSNAQCLLSLDGVSFKR